MGQLTINYSVIGTGAVLFFSILACFFGVKLFKILAALCGLLIGAAAGYIVPSHYFQLDQAVCIGIAVVSGIIFAILLFKLYYAAVMLNIWACAAGIAALFIRPAAPLYWLACAGIGLVFGLIGLKFARPLMILGSGIFGGVYAGLAAGVLFSFPSRSTGLMAGALLAAVGIFVQFLMEGHRKSRQAASRAKEIRHTVSVENDIEAARSLFEASGVSDDDDDEYEDE